MEEKGSDRSAQLDADGLQRLAPSLPVLPSVDQLVHRDPVEGFRFLHSSAIYGEKICTRVQTRLYASAEKLAAGISLRNKFPLVLDVDFYFRILARDLWSRCSADPMPMFGLPDKTA
jgi:hypothetical protein